MARKKTTAVAGIDFGADPPTTVVRQVEDSELAVTYEWLRSSGFQPPTDPAVDEHRGRFHQPTYRLIVNGRQAVLYVARSIGVDQSLWLCQLANESQGVLVGIRYVKTRGEIARLVEALTGNPWTMYQRAASAQGPATASQEASRG